MKKYLFLLFLFGFYIGLSLYKKDLTRQVISYDDINNNSINEFSINFNNKINSNDLVSLFSNYNPNYYINKININNQINEVSCDFINMCINDVFLTNNNEFYNNYIATGFNIDSICIITDSSKLFDFLESNDINYTIN